MKWKNKQTPKLNDERERVIFAFLPHECEDGYTRWFEYILIFERFTRTYNQEGDGYLAWYEYGASGL